MKSIDDIKGKRVIVGDKGSGTDFDVQRILATMNMTYNDIQPIYVYYAAAVQRMQDEQADLLFWTAGVPISSITEIATTKDVDFLSFPDDVVKKLAGQIPLLHRRYHSGQILSETAECRSAASPLSPFGSPARM